MSVQTKTKNKRLFLVVPTTRANTIEGQIHKVSQKRIHDLKSPNAAIQPTESQTVFSIKAEAHHLSLLNQFMIFLHTPGFLFIMNGGVSIITLPP